MTPFILLLCTTGLVHAAPGTEPVTPPAPSVEAPPQAGIQYEVQLRSEYLAGQPIVVPIRVWNSSTTVQTVPDLERRPWLVGFTFKLESGELERRRTTPPETDTGQTLRLAPRSQRRTLLELPLGNGLKPGEYNLQVQLMNSAEPEALATQTVQVAAPHPVEADLMRGVSAAHRSTDSVVWLHKAREGFDLYLSPARGTKHGRTRWLAHLPGQVSPSLTESSSAEGGTRHVVWMSSDRSIQWLPVETLGVASKLHSLDTPWPLIELVGHPATDGTGNLHVPVWIPAPKGNSGELRVLTIMDRGAVSYRRAAAFQTRPVSVATTVDDAGSVQLLVATDEAVDLYSIRNSGNTHTDLPIPGRRLVRAEDGTRLVDAQFGLLVSSGDRTGGLSVLSTASSARGLVSGWVSLQGSALSTLPPIEIPEGGILKDVLPGATHDTVGYLFKTGARSARYAEPTGVLDFEESLHGDWGLRRGKDGTVILTRTAKDAVFALRPLVPKD
jgi:hypothetical protein